MPHATPPNAAGMIQVVAKLVSTGYARRPRSSTSEEVGPNACRMFDTQQEDEEQPEGEAA
jgi:hypothetical protein